MTETRPFAVLAVGGLLAVSLAAGTAGFAPAQAQTTVTRSQTAPTGKAVRLVIAPGLKKDCSAGPMPEVKVMDAPKNGSLITRAGKIKTPGSYRCPNKETGAQAVFYQSKPGFTGADEVTVEIKTADGEVLRQNIRITVNAGKGSEKDGTKEGGATEL